MATQKDVILIVDDTPTNLEVLLEVLNKRGFKILVAEDGESALTQIEYALPDIILLDVMMPGIDGFETCRRLKKEQKTKDIPIIFMTALSETVDKVKGFEVGAVDYITKPLQHEEVIARVDTHLSLRKLQKELQRSNEQLQEASAWINREIDEIATLQRSLMPAKDLSCQGLEVATYWKSYDRAGGDYFDIIAFDSEFFKQKVHGFLVADASGHGPSAAVIIAMLYTLLRNEETKLSSPAKLLDTINRKLVKMPIGNSFITAICVLYLPEENRLVYASAGHNYPMLLLADGSVNTLESDNGLPLGIMEDAFLQDVNKEVPADATLVLYTDGITEARNKEKKFFNEEGLENALKEAKGSAQEIRDMVLSQVEKHENGHPPSDDKTLLIIKRT